MPPITSSTISGSNRYGFPFLGSIDEKLQEQLDVSSLDGTDFVDDDGILIPGTPLRLVDNLLVPVDGGGQEVRGFVLEQVKIAKDNASGTLSAADDLAVVIVVKATVDRATVENNIGRVLTANEISAIEAADHFVLTDPES